MSSSPTFRRAGEVIKRGQLNNTSLYYIFESANMRPQANHLTYDGPPEVKDENGKVVSVYPYDKYAFDESNPPRVKIYDAYEEVDSSSNIDSITVLGHSGIDIDVNVLGKNNAIHFCSAFDFRKSFNRNEKLELVNQLNLTMTMGRFGIFDDSSPYGGFVDYDLPIGEG